MTEVAYTKIEVLVATSSTERANDKYLDPGNPFTLFTGILENSHVSYSKISFWLFSDGFFSYNITISAVSSPSQC